MTNAPLPIRAAAFTFCRRPGTWSARRTRAAGEGADEEAEAESGICIRQDGTAEILIESLFSLETPIPGGGWIASALSS
jgi:hypothetical protein